MPSGSLRFACLAYLLVLASPAAALSVGDLVGIGFPTGGSAGVYAIDLEGETAQRLGTIPAPGALTLGYRHVVAEPGGTVLVAGTPGVQRLDPVTGLFTPLSAEPASHIDVAPDGSIYVASGSTLYALDPTSGVRTPLYADAIALTGLNGLAAISGALVTTRQYAATDPANPDLTKREDLVSIDLGTGAVSVVSTLDAEYVNPFLGVYFQRGTFGLENAPDGTIFQGTSFRSFTDGANWASAAPDTPSYGWGEDCHAGGAAVDASLRLVVSIAALGCSGEILRRTGAANTSEFFAFPGLIFNDVDFVPVPEPGTLLLLAIGLAGLKLRPRVRPRA